MEPLRRVAVSRISLGTRIAQVALATALLASCASPPRLALPATPAAEAVALHGRISVRSDDNQSTRGFSGLFDLQGTAEAGALTLSTPLGTVVAEARWLGAEGELTGSDGTRRRGDLDTLTRDALGETLPLTALISWLQGRPDARLPSRPLTPPAQGFEQLGWRIDLGGQADGRIEALRPAASPLQPAAVTVRVRLDR